MSAEQIAAKMRELDDDEMAEALTQETPAAMRSFGLGDKLGSLFSPRPWQHTAHTFGYIGQPETGEEALSIEPAGTIAADDTLKNSRVKITLDHLRVADYPGRGMHQVLFDFYAQNQIPSNVEHLHFNATYRVQEGEHAAVIGYPIFVGLNVGCEGVAFKCRTVNVKNDKDEAFLGFLESDAFKEGLRLATTAQPAIGLFSETALGLTKAIGQRHRNAPVQDFYMGLDFSTIATRARLAEGSYMAVQIPESFTTVWRWDEWTYDRSSGRVVNKSDKTQLVPYNYVVFSISRYEGA